MSFGINAIIDYLFDLFDRLSRYPRHLHENLNYGGSEIGRAFWPLHFARSSVRTETVPHSRPFLCLLRRSYSPPGPLIVLIQT